MTCANPERGHGKLSTVSCFSKAYVPPVERERFTGSIRLRRRASITDYIDFGPSARPAALSPYGGGFRVPAAREPLAPDVNRSQSTPSLPLESSR